MSEPSITPRLVVHGADRAIALYQRVLGAKLLERFADERLGGLVVHAALQIGNGVVSVVDEQRELHNHAPTSIGATPVLLHVTVSDPDAVAEQLARDGGEIVFAVADQFYGKREGRVRDPFGHVWIVSKPIEQLSHEVIEQRLREPAP